MLFVIITRDGQDQDALNRRMAVREAHLAGFKRGMEAKEHIVGGALLDEQGTMRGSMMVVDYPDRAALDEWLNNDPYVTGGVWKDIEMVPFRLAGKI